MKKSLVKFLRIPVSLAALLLSVTAMATNAPVSQQQLEQFHSANVKDKSLCQYTFGSHRDGHGGMSPLFFRVKDIYIHADGGDLYDKKNEIIPYTRNENIGVLSGCALEKIIGTHIPIYIPPKGDYSLAAVLRGGSAWDSFLSWPAEKQDDSLIIDLSVNLTANRSFYHHIKFDKIVVVQAFYYRHGVNDLRSLNGQCSTAFPYLNDEPKMQILLTDAVQQCLDQDYRQ